MSKLIVEVCEIAEIKSHQNADNLELAVVKGFQCVVRKGTFAVGDKIVYFPPDTMLSKELAESFGVTNYLQWKPDGMGRTRTVRLRGEPSFGLAVPVPDASWEVGRDVVGHYGVKKYEPPVREVSADTGVDIPSFHKYTSIENLRHFPDLFVNGEEVIATEKIHGSNQRTGLVCVRDENRDIEIPTFMAGSHHFRRKIPVIEQEHNLDFSNGMAGSVQFDCGDRWKNFHTDFEMLKTNRYWYPVTMFDVRALLYYTKYTYNANAVILFGEVFGANIQKGFYYGSKSEMQFRAFDISVDGKYLDYDTFKGLCDKFAVATCPVLYRGPYNFEILRKYVNGATQIANCGQIREGIVIRPFMERFHPKVGRLVAKFVGDEYLASKENGSVSDYTEE